MVRKSSGALPLPLTFCELTCTILTLPSKIGAKESDYLEDGITASRV